MLEPTQGTTNPQFLRNIDLIVAKNLPYTYFHYDQDIEKNSVGDKQSFIKIRKQWKLLGNLQERNEAIPFYAETGVKGSNFLVKTVIGTASYDRMHNCIVISYRGSKNIHDWGNNLNFCRKIITDVSNEDNFKLHAGYFDVAESSKESLLQAINQIKIKIPFWKKKQIKLLLTGHSLGGAAATYAAYLLSLQNITNSKNIHVRTFAAPPVATKNLNEWLGKNLGSIVSFYLKNDIYPGILPSCYGLQSAGKIMTLPSPRIAEIKHPILHDYRLYQLVIYTHYGIDWEPNFFIVMTLLDWKINLDSFTISKK